jgi:hypothetical protein
MSLKILYINIISLYLLGCTNNVNKKIEGERFIIGKVNNITISVVASEKEGSYFLYPKVFIGEEIVFTDTTPSFYNLKDNASKIITLKKNINHFYILIEKTDPITNDKWVVLSIINNKLSKSYEVIKDITKDIDNDGFIEAGGMKTDEGYCVDCDSAYYNPYRIYKLGDKFEFDQITSERLTKEIYGVYLGNERKDTVLKVLKNKI